MNLTKEEQLKVIHLEITCVLPEYRGNGLQKKLGNLIMKEFIETSNDYRYLCCTVSPTNFPSLKDKLVQGILIAKLKEKYSGRIRYILLKDLQSRSATNSLRIYLITQFFSIFFFFCIIATLFCNSQIFFS